MTIWLNHIFVAISTFFFFSFAASFTKFFLEIFPHLNTETRDFPSRFSLEIFPRDFPSRFPSRFSLEISLEIFPRDFPSRFSLEISLEIFPRAQFAGFFGYPPEKLSSLAKQGCLTYTFSVKVNMQSQLWLLYTKRPRSPQNPSYQLTITPKSLWKLSLPYLKMCITLQFRYISPGFVSFRFA